MGLWYCKRVLCSSVICREESRAWVVRVMRKNLMRCGNERYEWILFKIYTVFTACMIQRYRFARLPDAAERFSWYVEKRTMLLFVFTSMQLCKSVPCLELPKRSSQKESNPQCW